MVNLRGKVVSGSGEGAKFTELPWVKKQITEKLGYIPHPGTLNIKLTKTKFSPKNLFKKVKWVEILPVNNFCRGKLVKAYLLDDLECAIIIPEVENYPEDIVELIAPINLREKFKLKDGDSVGVKITLS